MLEDDNGSTTSETKLILHLGLYYIVGIVGYVYVLQEFEESIVDTLYFSTAVLTTVRRTRRRREKKFKFDTTTYISKTGWIR